MNKSRDTAPRQLFERRDVSASGVKQISGSNCVIVVQRVEEYLKTGVIKKTVPTKALDVYILADVYPEALGFRQQRLTVTEKAMREGERGIIYGIRKINPKEGHVFNVIKHKGQIKYLDGQAAIPAEIRGGNYKLFEYLQTYKPN